VTVPGGIPRPRGPRLRELGLRIGLHDAGAANAITDVPGVSVGHVTAWRDEPDPPEGRGAGRSGVTAIVPADPETLVREPVPAGTDVLNGAGELTSSIAVREWGVIQTPVYLTATMSVGRVYDGAVRAAIAADPAVGVTDFVIPVVGECDDGWLSEARVVQVELEDVEEALSVAGGGAVDEGAVGAGTGMISFGYKAGIGTASRLLPELGATLGVLVLANFGARSDLVVDGVPVGRLLGGVGAGEEDAGSCIAIVVTDLPLGTHELTRVARRCALGLARTGSVAYDGSGEIFLALSTGGRVDRDTGGTRAVASRQALNELFLATVEATEEAVLNSLWAAPDVVGREGRLAPGIPHADVLQLLREHRRLG
jgi:D-aminopeptidase